MTMNSLVHWPHIEDIQFHDPVADDEVTADELAVCESNDEVFRLREWGTHRMVSLQVLAGRQDHTGSVSTSALEIVGQNLTRGIRGLELTCEGHSWRLNDWEGAADLKQDGISTREVTLLPGTEVTIARRILIAESPRTIALQAFLSRLLGWSDRCIEVVDQALRAIRLASSGRAMLLVRGVGDLVPIAAAIHHHALGREAPFIVSDPRRRNTRETVRLPTNREEGMAALDKAFGGTLCVRAGRVPADFDDVLKTLQSADSGVRLLICVGNSALKRVGMTATPIDIPPIETRQEELPRIIKECADEALELSSAPRSCLNQQDLEWVSQLPNPTIPEIDKALRRVVAIKTSRNISTAARKLGMAPVSLTRWLARRVSKVTSLYVPQPDRSMQRYPERLRMMDRTPPRTESITTIETDPAVTADRVRDAQEDSAHEQENDTP
jgi:hypothetical protein